MKQEGDVMSDSQAGAAVNKELCDVAKNGDMAQKLFKAYYHDHVHSGKIYEDFHSFFMVKPSAVEGKVVATRGSEKLLLDDCIQRAKERNGYISVSKHRNPKLGYYWLELS